MTGEEQALRARSLLNSPQVAREARMLFDLQQHLPTPGYLSMLAVCHLMAMWDECMTEDWSKADENELFRQVDELTAKLRKTVRQFIGEGTRDPMVVRVALGIAYQAVTVSMVTQALSEAEQ